MGVSTDTVHFLFISNSWGATSLGNTGSFVLGDYMLSAVKTSYFFEGSSDPTGEHYSPAGTPTTIGEFSAALQWFFSSLTSYSPLGFFSLGS